MQESTFRNQLSEDVNRLQAALTQKQRDDRRSLELKCLLAKHDLTRSKYLTVVEWCWLTGAIASTVGHCLV